MSSSNRALSRPWAREEVERLISWMETNPTELNGKQVTWYKDVKQQVYPNEDHITVKKICDKVNNMKKGWKEAKAMMERAGWAPRQEMNEKAVNEALERKCLFFWRLEEIWGKTAPLTVASTGTTTVPTTGRAVAPRLAPRMQAATMPPPMAPASAPGQSVPHSPTPDADEESEGEGEGDPDWNAITPVRLTPTPGPATPAPQPPPLSQELTRPSTFRGLSVREKLDMGALLKRVFEEKQSSKEAIAAKRLKADIELQREKIAAESQLQREKIAAETELQRERIAAESRRAENIAQIHADAQVKQVESFTRVMEQMLLAMTSQRNAAVQQGGGK